MDLSANINVANVTQFVADPNSEYLYLATSTGWVYKWDAVTGTVVASAQVGVNLTSIAISPDGSTVIVGEANSSTGQPTIFHEVSTSTMTSTDITVPAGTTYPNSFYESYKYGVDPDALAITSTGQVFFQSSYGLSGFLPATTFSLSQSAAPSASYIGSIADGATFIPSEDGRYVLITQRTMDPVQLQLYNAQTGSFISFYGVTGAVSDRAGLVAVADGGSIYNSADVLIRDLQGNLVKDLGSSYTPFAMAFAGGGDQLLVWDSGASELRVYDTHSWAQVATIAMPATYSSNNGERWGDLSAGDNGAFVYVGGQMASIDLAAKGLTEITASAPSATLIEAGLNPDGSATAGVSTSTANLTPNGGTAALTYATAGWTSLGSGLYSHAGTYGSAVLDTVHNTLTYTLDNTLAATRALAPGATVADAFTVAACLGDHGAGF